VSSLRSRLLTGALLWTVGIVTVVHFMSVALIHRFPRTMGLVHISLLFILTVGLIGAGLWQVRSGLTSLAMLRARLGILRQGRARRIEGDYPEEVQPLVADLNALLDERERRVARAQAKAGDLAHGLKTPLAVLAQEAERAGAAGQHELAAAMGEQVERMRRQIESHLAQARADASGASPEARARVADSAQALARTLLRLHAERGVAIDVQVPAGLVVRIAREELDEMLGNLLDNACKWARSRVTIAAVASEGRIVIDVDDDGSGLEPEMREQVLRRGVRADETAPGSGLGLAIVRDLAELHGGSVALVGSPLGGIRARLELPGEGAQPTA
jgi:signal transduction histidine kinase